MPGENYLLSIGIGIYQGAWDDLENPKRDVLRLHSVLTTMYGFKPIQPTLLDNEATSDAIRDALAELRRTIGSEDNLIIHFAGHGELDAETNKGCWIPHDGTKPGRYISNSAVVEALEVVDAKHILLISDSCFAGSFLSRDRGAIRLSLAELEKLDSRWILASCGMEKTPDQKEGSENSPFAQSLCKFLEENTIAEFPARSLYEAVIIKTPENGGKKPLVGHFNPKRHKDGEMIFRLQGSASELPPLSPTMRYVVIPPKPKIVFPLPALPIENSIPRSLTYYEQQSEDDNNLYRSQHGKTELNQAFISHLHLVVLGAPGSGKTIEVLKLAHELNNTDSPYTPIYIRLNTFAGESIPEILPEGWNEHNGENLVLFLDGLDEIQQDQFPTSVIKINEFKNQYPSARIIVTCRTNFYNLPRKRISGTLPEFSVFVLEDISLKEVRDFAERKPDINGQKFIEDSYHASFLDLVQKPFFLQLLLDHYVRNGRFTLSKVKLLEAGIFEYFAQDYNRPKNSGLPIHQKETLDTLTKIAFVMEYMGRNYITNDELEQMFPIADAYKRCFELPTFRKTGINNHWMFEHNNIQEFLAAKVLAVLPFEKLISAISIPVGDDYRVKPTWVNTISFFVTIGDEEPVKNLLDWIIKNDIEVLIKFDPDRLEDQQRIDIFKNIFEDYSNKNIWLSSNKFSDADLANFGEFGEIIEFLLEKIANLLTPRITRLNAIKVLDNFDLRNFDQYKDAIQQALLKALDINNSSSQDLYSVIGALANLKLTSRDVLNIIISKFRNNKNQYIRAGLYKIIGASDFVNEYLDVLLDGLDLSQLKNAIGERDSVNLMDESHHLVKAISKTDSVQGISRILMFFTDEKRRIFYQSDYKAIIETLTNTGIHLFNSEPTIYDLFRDLFVSSVKSYEREIPDILFKFFEKTTTDQNLFEDIWKGDKKKLIDRRDFEDLLINEKSVNWFIQSCKKGDYSQEDAEQFHSILFWKSQRDNKFANYLEHFENSLSDIDDFKVSRPQIPNWSEKEREKIIYSFEMLFHPEQLKAEIESVFIDLEKTELVSKDIFDQRRASLDSNEGFFAETAIDLLRDFTYRGNTVTLNEINTFFQNEEAVLSFQINEIYNYLKNYYRDYITIDGSKLELIKKWCHNFPGDWEKLWFFIHSLDIGLPEKDILELTLYYDFNLESKITETGTIEGLLKFVSAEKLKERVANNLRGKINNSIIWVSNAGYALRHNMQDSYPDIVSFLEKVGTDEYKFNEVLSFWYSKTSNSGRLVHFIKSCHSEILLWEAIDLLIKAHQQAEFLKEFLYSRMQDSSVIDYRLKAADHLMRLDDLRGFIFTANYILSNSNPEFEFRHNLGYMTHLTNPQALPLLMELLHLAKQPAYQKDNFNSLESVVTDALYSIGKKTENNFIEVRDHLKQFMITYKSELPHINFLQFIIDRLEQELNMSRSQSPGIKEAIKDWKKLQENN